MLKISKFGKYVLGKDFSFFIGMENYFSNFSFSMDDLSSAYANSFANTNVIHEIT